MLEKDSLKSEGVDGLELKSEIIVTEKNTEVCVEKSFLEHAQSDE